MHRQVMELVEATLDQLFPLQQALSRARRAEEEVEFIIVRLEEVREELRAINFRQVAFQRRRPNPSPSPPPRRSPSPVQRRSPTPPIVQWADLPQWIPPEPIVNGFSNSPSNYSIDQDEPQIVEEVWFVEDDQQPQQQQQQPQQQHQQPQQQHQQPQPPQQQRPPLPPLPPLAPPPLLNPVPLRVLLAEERANAEREAAQHHQQQQHQQHR